MVRIALFGAALIAAVTAVPVIPVIEGFPSQISDHLPMMTGKPVVPFPEATKTGKHHHHHSPTPHHHTPHSPHHTPHATPRPHHGEGHHMGGHLPKLPTHILPRWLVGRAEPIEVESDGHRGKKGPEATHTAKHNPQFPEHTKGHHGHHTPTPSPHHGHHTPTPRAHHGHHSGPFEIPLPTGIPMLSGKGPRPTGIHHPEPLIGTPQMAGGHARGQ